MTELEHLVAQLTSKPVPTVLHCSSAGRPVLILSDLHLGMPEGFGFSLARTGPLIEVLEAAVRMGALLIFNGDIVDGTMSFAGTLELLKPYPGLIDALRRAVASLEVLLVTGNHDPLDIGVLGWKVCDAIVLDESTLIVHGDRLDIALQGRRHGSFERFYGLFNRFAGVPLELPLLRYESLRNRLYVWSFLTVCWHLLTLSNALGLSRLRARVKSLTDYLLRMETGQDPGRVIHGVVAVVDQLPFRRLILGHTHLPGQMKLAHITYVNTGTWRPPLTTITLIQGDMVKVLDFCTQREHDDTLMKSWHLPVDWESWWKPHGAYIRWHGVSRFIIDRILRPKLPMMRGTDETT